MRLSVARVLALWARPFTAFSAAAPASFACPFVRPAKELPSTIHELHPGHVSVVMAMGDSITAAFASHNVFLKSGVQNPLELPKEWRSVSFSGGEGTDDHQTLPYFLRHYNASLVGTSSGLLGMQDPRTGYRSPDSNFLNAALCSAMSHNLMMEFYYLQRQSSRVPHFRDRWKILTIFIGANDLCYTHDPCDGKEATAHTLAERFADNLRAVLSKVRDSFGRTLVNLVSIFNIASVHKLTHRHPYCFIVGRIVDECPCTQKPRPGESVVTDRQLNDLMNTTILLNNRIRDIAGEFDQRSSDFAVIAQVHVENQDVPNIGFLSDLDCFHPSAIGQYTMGVLLWNSMFEHHNRTPTPIDISVQPFCPTADSVFYTGAVSEHQRSGDSTMVV